MLRNIASFLAQPPSRNAITVASSKSKNMYDPVICSSEEGFKLASIAQPSLWPGTSRVAIVFSSGSRSELDSKDHGLTHLLRRTFGLSTSQHTAVNLTRHFQQMGARVMCTTTREHMIYTVDVAPNLISRAGNLLAEMATDVAYYEWELKNTANKLMQHDVEVLNRRNLPALSMELLHEAAFGQHPLGSGLGNSLFSAADRVGGYSWNQIDQFHDHVFTPTNCTLALVGHAPEQDGTDLLREIKTGLNLRAPRETPERAGKVHGFVGGDIRRDLAAAPLVLANLAWPTGGETSAHRDALDVIASLITGCMGRVAFGGSSGHCIPPAAQDDETQVAAFHRAYSDHGLLGISVSGYSSAAVNDRLCRVRSHLAGLRITEKDLAMAKSLRKADILMKLECPTYVATDLAIQVSSPPGNYECPSGRLASIDALKVEEVNKVLAETLSNPLAALSVVGPEASEILPLKVILSA